MTRHRLFAVAASGALVAALAACSPSEEEPTDPADPAATTGPASPGDGATTAPVPGDDQTTTAPPEANGTVDDVTVEVDEQGVPTIELPQTPFVVAETGATTVADGDGEEVQDGQDVEVNYVGVNASTGETFESTYDAGTTVRMPLGNPGLLPGFLQTLPGTTVGQTLVVAMTPEDAFGPQGNPPLGVGPQDTLVFYVEVVDLPLTQAEGEEVTDLPEGLPTVEADGVAPATVTIPEGEDAPTELVVQPLIEGEGEPIEAGQTVTVNYTGVAWETGEQFDSNLAREPVTPFSFPLGQGGVIAGWDEGLAGQSIGSRVLLVVPPDLAYGASEDDPLAENTLVFVVDILDAQ